jgi:segregation and condensation protein B
LKGYTQLKGPIQALLFANGDPLSVNKLVQILKIPEENILALIAELMQDMNGIHSGLTIVEVAGGYQICTKPELAAVVEELAQVHETRLSLAAMETVAIIAFKQPVTKQEIDSIRGVKTDRVLTTLLERQLIKEIGRKEAIGRPILYGTTDAFLQCFGLKNLSELPPLADFLSEKQP